MFEEEARVRWRWFLQGANFSHSAQPGQAGPPAHPGPAQAEPPAHRGPAQPGKVEPPAHCAPAQPGPVEHAGAPPQPKPAQPRPPEPERKVLRSATKAKPAKKPLEAQRQAEQLPAQPPAAKAALAKPPPQVVPPRAAKASAKATESRAKPAGPAGAKATAAVATSAAATAAVAAKHRGEPRPLTCFTVDEDEDVEMDEVWEEAATPQVVKREYGPYRPKKRSTVVKTRSYFKQLMAVRPKQLVKPKQLAKPVTPIMDINVKEELTDADTETAQILSVSPSIERSMMIGLWNRVKREQVATESRRGRWSAICSYLTQCYRKSKFKDGRELSS